MDTPQTLAADMLKAAGKAVAGTRAVVQKGALNVKTESIANVKQSAPVHHAYAAAAITYDTGVLRTGTTVDAEIGYDKDKGKAAGKKTGPGGLGNILEYGSRHNPGHRDLGRALDNEEPRFEAAIAAMVERLL